MTNNLEQISQETPTLKKVLVVDDQFGRDYDPMFPDRYEGKVEGYTFVLEDAVERTEKRPLPWDKNKLVDTPIYTSAKVITRVEKEGDISLVLLDMNFGDQTNFGLEIMRNLNISYPNIPVLIHSTPENKESKLAIDECITKYGAKEFIGKCPSASRLKEFLDKYTGGSK